MPYYKAFLRGGMFDYVVLEAENVEDAYEYAQGIPIIFGNAFLQEHDLDPQLCTDPLKEPYLIFTNAYRVADDEARAARYEHTIAERNKKARKKS